MRKSVFVTNKTPSTPLPYKDPLTGRQITANGYLFFKDSRQWRHVWGTETHSATTFQPLCSRGIPVKTPQK